MRDRARAAILYYREIPGMIKLLRQEREELEGDYYGLRGVALDGIPHGTSDGRQVEQKAISAEEKNVAERMREIARKLEELEADRTAIQRVIDGLAGRYKTVLLMRYVRGYSWAKISVRTGVPDSTVRHWHKKALERMEEAVNGAGNAAIWAHACVRAFRSI